jgi:Tfp pilus assembly protein PilO
MPKSSKLAFLSTLKTRDHRVVLRAILGLLLALNLIAAAMVMFPPGGSAEQLEKELVSLQSQARVRRKTLETTIQHVASVEKGRSQGDQFLSEYFLAQRTAYSTLLDDLEAAAKQSQIKARERSFALEPIEGSDTLSLMTITANYEGTYKDVMNFVHQVDQSPRLMVIESLNAAPQTGSNTLSVSMKIDAFVRSEAGE